MAADLPLPKQVLAHGWILKDSVKMSKSRGNVVRPEPIRQVLGADPLRYFLLREIPFGQDGNFSYDALITRINADLANGLGNLASRTLAMVRQYRGGAIPASEGIAEIRAEAERTIAAYRESFERYEFNRALEQLWALLTLVDKAIVQYQPWTLAKQKEASPQARLDAILYTAAETVRLATALLAPVMPASCATLWAQLGYTTPVESCRLDQLSWGQLAGGQPVGEAAAVFPRVDAQKAIAEIMALDDQEADRINTLLGKTEPAALAPPPEPEWAPPPGVPPLAPQITIEDFAKVDLRVARVLAAERVQGADKLLKLTIDAAEKEPRTLVAGIATAYAPETLVGRKIVIVANLVPRKVRGVVSNGMIVAASLEGGDPVIAGFLEDIPVGARLK
jgi:methionyl-tRNA synthetase